MVRTIRWRAALVLLILLVAACNLQSNEQLSPQNEQTTDHPIVKALSGEIVVTDADDFDGDELSPRWGGFGERPPLEDGVVTMTGTGGWDTGLERTGFGDNEGIMIDLQYESGAVYGMFFQAGLFESEDWHQFGFEGLDGDEHTFANWGARGGNWVVLQDDFELQNGIWYTVVQRVLPGGRFSTHIWNRDDPNGYLFNAVTVPPDDVDWDRRTWLYTISIMEGTIRADNYRALQFPVEFEMPASPPNAD